MRALTWAGGRDVLVTDVPAPRPGDGQVLVDVAYIGLCGTDLHICAGEHPRAQPGLVIGHEMSGTLHDDAPGMPAGSRVVVDPLLPCGRCRTCRGGRPQTCVSLRLLGIDAPGGGAAQVAVDAARLISVEGDVDLRRLAFAEPLAVAVRAVRQSALRLGETVLVMGAGPIGAAVASCARMSGAGRVVLSEPSQARRDFAASLGFEVVGPLPVGDDTQDIEADVVFDAAGHPSVAAALGDAVVPGGRVVVVAVYGDPVPLDLRAVTFKELTVIGTRVYSRNDIEAATRLIASRRFDPDPFITSTVTLDEAPEAIEALRAGRGVKVLVRPQP